MPDGSMRADVAALVARLAQGDRRALARALTWVENDPEYGSAVLSALPQGRVAYRVGLTGPPGAGKSTLVAQLVRCWREAGHDVAVLAVDPSSPFHGGALLGDRIRMQALAGDSRVFVRSVASRGASGGLSLAVHDLSDVLEAAGFDPLLIETVGVGQAEVEVAEAADVTVLVLAPGSGDAVQGMKAGLLEAADVIVVNQADREGADALVQAMTSAFEVRSHPPPPLLTTVATKGEGVQALYEQLLELGAVGRAADVLAARRLARTRARLVQRVDAALRARLWARVGDLRDELADLVAGGEMTLDEATRRLMAAADSA